MIRYLIALLLAVQSLPAMDFTSLESLPVQEGGRKKPYLVLADESLLTISGRSSLTDAAGHKLGAMDVITGLWLQPQKWADSPIIRINNKPLKEACGLPDKPELFSWTQLASSDGLRNTLAKVQDMRDRNPKAKLDAMSKAAVDAGAHIALFESIASGKAVAVVPGDSSIWTSLPDGSPVLQSLQTAFGSGDQTGFDHAVVAIREIQNRAAPGEQADPFKIALEVRYEKLHPFRLAWIFYLTAGLAVVLTLRAGSRAGYAVGWFFALAGFAMQITGFVFRIIISGRAPVTNMYESIVWVAFGTILFGLMFEAIHRCRYYMLGAIPVAVASLILADSQPVILDHSIHPLTAVLADNFWLSIHVLTITLSYAAFALSLGVGHILLGKVIFGSRPTAALYNYLYRSLQVGVLLLATGTILGAVWANYSWGRFWDFDPKETWALIALLCYLFILHGRIAGTWSGFGLAVGAVLAFQGVLMAWYGVNFVLGTGMHSYGFGVGGFGYAVGFVIAEFLFVALAVYRNKTISRGSGGRPARTSGQRLVSPQGA